MDLSVSTCLSRLLESAISSVFEWDENCHGNNIGLAWNMLLLSTISGTSFSCCWDSGSGIGPSRSDLANCKRMRVGMDVLVFHLP